MNSKNEGDDGKNPSCATRGTAFMAGVECLLFGTDPGATKITPDKKIEVLEPNVPSPRVIRPPPIK